MISASLSGVRIKGIVSAVPDSIRILEDDVEAFGEDAQRVFRNTGVRTRHVTKTGMCASDLMLPAALKLMDDLGWAPETIQALVVVTQGPDFPLPATACILQNRLGLPTSLTAFDVNLGCSGYVYGLWIVSSLLKTGLSRALLCVGDMSTRSISPADRAVWPLFGDGAAVTALETDAEAPPMTFTLGTDGTGAPHLILPVGARKPPTATTYERTLRSDGNVRSDRDLFMNGLEVVAFTLRRVPPMIRQARESAGWTVEDIDAYVFHQASTFVLKALGRACGIPKSRLVIGLEDWGNTSSASIPLAMSDKIRDQLAAGSQRLLLAGFGVGWSFGAATLTIGPIVAPKVLLVPDRPPEQPFGPLPTSQSEGSQDEEKVDEHSTSPATGSS